MMKNKSTEELTPKSQVKTTCVTYTVTTSAPLHQGIRAFFDRMKIEYREVRG